MALFPQERQVVVAGAGYAGLHTAAVLAERLKSAKDLRVTLLSDRDYFLDRCRLHEACVRDVAIRYALAPLFEKTVVDLVVGSLAHVDPEQKVLRVETPSHPYDLPYDELLLATGAYAHDYAIPGVHDHAWTLNGFEDAARIRNWVRGVAKEEAGAVRLAIVGGGLTGVELAAEVAECWREAKSGRVLLLEAQEEILPGLDQRIAKYARKRLLELGVEIHTKVSVGALEENGVRVGSGEYLEADRMVWCAGVRPHLPEGLEHARRGPAGRLPTDEALRLAVNPDVFLAGDLAACIPLGLEAPLVPAAQWAVQMGQWAGRLMAARALGEEPPPFQGFEDRGLMVSLGREAACGMAVVAGRKQFLSGFPAVLIKQSSLTYHLWGITGRTGVPPVAY